MKYAIIGGTGVYELPNLIGSEEVETEYGSVTVYLIDLKGDSVAFIPRHGKDHSKPPHLINYRANIKALKKLGVKHVFTTSIVGSCNILYEPGDVVMLEDFLDFTKSRSLTFYDELREEDKVRHLNMSEPYCHIMKDLFYSKAKENNLVVKGDVVYGSTEGPRFETRAETKMYEQLGSDVIGMTSIPEVILAKELGLCYSTIAIVGNWTTGYQEEFSRSNIKELVAEKQEKIIDIFLQVFEDGIDDRLCRCDDAFIDMSI